MPAISPHIPPEADLAPRVLAADLAFPEGPAFAPDGSLWCVELKGASLVRIAPGKLERIPVGGAPNGLAFNAEGLAVFCDADAGAIRAVDPHTGMLSTLVASGADRQLDRPNDLAFAPDGSLVFTCPGQSRTEPTGSVWCLSPQGELSRIADGLYFPNGLAFTRDGDLIVAETYRQRLWRGRWLGGSEPWTDAAVFATVPGPIGPDGMAVGADGRLHVAIYGQGMVMVLSPDGRPVHQWRTPGANPTNCAFDPDGALGLVVTEAGRGEVLTFPTAGRGVKLHG